MDEEDYAEGLVGEEFVDSDESDDEPIDGYEVAIRLGAHKDTYVLQPIDMSGIHKGQTWIIADGTPTEEYVQVK